MTTSQPVFVLPRPHTTTFANLLSRNLPCGLIRRLIFMKCWSQEVKTLIWNRQL